MEVRHPPRGVPVTVCVWGVSIMVWGGVNTPQGGCKKITGRSFASAQRNNKFTQSYNEYSSLVVHSFSELIR